MKKSLILSLAVILFCTPSLFAPWHFSFPSDVDIDSLLEMWKEPGTVTETKDTSPSDGAEFTVSLNDETYSGFWKTAMGKQDGAGMDLSAYDGILLKFENTHATEEVMVNIFMQSGPGWDFYEADWTWLEPGETTSLYLTGDNWQNSDNVKRWGFQVGTNGPESVEEFNGSEVRVLVTPEPSTICLLSLGALGLFRRRRK